MFNLPLQDAMKYQGLKSFRHDMVPRLGVLVANLGTPDAPDTPSLRRYLREFLSDPRVVETPKLIWQPILRGIILNTRPKRSARAYREVWTEEGSPLMLYSAGIARGISERLEREVGQPVLVRLGMRYGQPAVGRVINEMMEAGVRKLVVLPLYPQYSASTTGSVFDAVSRFFMHQRWVPDLNFISAYFDHPAYINTLAESVEKHWAAHGRSEHLLMSFHGIPREYFISGDPYHCHCQATGRMLAERLGLPPEAWTLTFQSRFGPKEWLTPYTDETLVKLAESGTRRVDVVCPGFAADCLETLEEIAGENRELFEASGGEHLTYIPALNDSEAHLDMLTGLVRSRMACWLSTEASSPPEEAAAETLARAQALGATR